MPSTIPVSRSLTLCQKFVRNAPLTFAGGDNDPGLANADWVRQFLLAAPLAWPWNRGKVTFVCALGKQDYVVPVAGFGWLEKGVYTDPDSSTHELEVETDLAEESVPNAPTRVSAQVDDGAGNITFRLMPPPDKAYTITLTYQKAAPLFAATTDSWSPIPDQLSYLFHQGLLAKTYEYLDDPRYQGAMSFFVRQVVAANAGLSDTERDIFLNDQNNVIRDRQAALQTSQNGRQARGMF